MPSQEEAIREYYARIDANDTNWVLALFAPDVLYERAGMVYQGEAQLRHFFCVQRKIRGSHEVERLWRPEADIVVAIGCFKGVGADGSARKVRFADIWCFDESGHVQHRETFLGTGHKYVEG